MTTTFNIKDWPRGTTPPWILQFRDARDGSPYSLTGCTIVVVVRDEKWETGYSDENARIKWRASIYDIYDPDDIDEFVPNPQDGDIVWIGFDESCVRREGGEWVPIPPDENKVLEGQVSIRFKRMDTMIDVGMYQHSVDIVFANGEIQKVLRGQFRITENTVNDITVEGV